MNKWKLYIAEFLSVFVPGLGQIYLGDYNAGIFCFFMLFWGILSKEVGGYLVVVLVWLYGILNTYYLYSYIHSAKKSIWLSKWWFIFIICIAIWIVVINSIP